MTSSAASQSWTGTVTAPRPAGAKVKPSAGAAMTSARSRPSRTKTGGTAGTGPARPPARLRPRGRQQPAGVEAGVGRAMRPDAREVGHAAGRRQHGEAARREAEGADARRVDRSRRPPRGHVVDHRRQAAGAAAEVGRARLVAVVVARMGRRRDDEAGLRQRERRGGMAGEIAAVAVRDHHQRQAAAPRGRLARDILRQQADGGRARRRLGGIPDADLERRRGAIRHLQRREADRRGRGLAGQRDKRAEEAPRAGASWMTVFRLPRASAGPGVAHAPVRRAFAPAPGHAGRDRVAGAGPAQPTLRIRPGP